MKKIFGVFILLVLMLCGGLSPTVFNNTLNAYNINFSQKSESSTHDFEEDLYKHYYIKEENNFYYINLQTNKIEHYNFGSITSSEGSNTINFENAAETLDYNKDYTFTLYLWIDGETFTNPTVMANQEFNFDMRCSITSANS